MISITAVQIKNYKSVKDSGLIDDISRIFALIGRNNTGKSTFLKAILCLFGEKDVDASDFHKGTPENIEIYVKLRTWEEDAPIDTDLKMVVSQDLKNTYYCNGIEVNGKVFKGKLPTLLYVPDIRNPNESTTIGQKTTILKKIIALHQETSLGSKEEYLKISEKLKKLKQDDADVLSKSLSERFKTITGEHSYSVNILPYVNIEKSVDHRSAIRNDSVPGAINIDIVDSGTGLQSMYLLALLEVYADMEHEGDDTILLVEEPEVYLHPEYQRRMFATLRRIAAVNQVIFTTHSPIMIADIWLTKSVRQVRHNNIGETLIEKIKIEDVIAELGIRYEDVLNPSLVVFVEGKDDPHFYTKIGIVSPKIKIIETEGFKAMHFFAFIKIISSEHVSNNFVLITDSDAEDPIQRIAKIKSNIEEQFNSLPEDFEKKISGNIYVLPKYSIESYLMDVTTLTKAFPTISDKAIASFVESYELGYSNKLTLVKDDKLRIETFQKFAKPKIMFSAHKSETNPHFLKAFEEFWADYPDVLAVRGQILTLCERIERSGKSWLEHILEFADLTKFDELLKLRDAILEKSS